LGAPRGRPAGLPLWPFWNCMVFPFVAVRLDGVGVPDTAPQTQSARAASRRAQFQLWIFSYTILVGPSKNYVSRVLI